MVKCKKILHILARMTGTRRFCLSRWPNQQNFHTQEWCTTGLCHRTNSVQRLPKWHAWNKIFEIWICRWLDSALPMQDIQEIETVLSDDLSKSNNYFKQWYLRLNTTKTTTSLFHLDNHRANQILKVNIDNKLLPHDPCPKYLGVTLDRTLTYRTHLCNVSKKLNARTALIHKLAATKWGANQTVLKVSVLALCYSVAEYCVAVWERSAHTNKVDTQLRTAMRSGVRRKFSWEGVHSVGYGGHLYLVCAVCDVTIWRHSHVSKPTFWQVCWHNMNIILHLLPLFYVPLHWIQSISAPSRPVTSLGHQEGWRVFREGPTFFLLCPIFLNYIQHISQGGGFAPMLPPGYGPGSKLEYRRKINSTLQHNSW